MKNRFSFPDSHPMGFRRLTSRDPHYRNGIA
jgi:hypothetical protein